MLHLLGKVKSTDIIEASGNRQVVSSGLYTSLPLTDDLSCLFVTWETCGIPVMLQQRLCLILQPFRSNLQKARNVCLDFCRKKIPPLKCHTLRSHLRRKEKRPIVVKIKTRFFLFFFALILLQRVVNFMLINHSRNCLHISVDDGASRRSSL